MNEINWYKNTGFDPFFRQYTTNFIMVHQVLILFQYNGDQNLYVLIHPHLHFITYFGNCLYANLSTGSNYWVCPFKTFYINCVNSACFFEIPSSCFYKIGVSTAPYYAGQDWYAGLVCLMLHLLCSINTYLYQRRTFHPG